MSTYNVPNRVEVLKHKFTQSIGLPFRELLPEQVIQESINQSA